MKILYAGTPEMLEKTVNEFLEQSDILYKVDFSHSDKYYAVLSEIVPRQLVDFVLAHLPYAAEIGGNVIATEKKAAPKKKAAPVIKVPPVKKAAVKKSPKKAAANTDTKTT